MRTRQVHFLSGLVVLTGELAIPEGGATCPGVVLLHGAAWGERRFHRAFEEAFSEAGIVTLAFDRRGEGESEGSRNSDLFTLADDAVAAVSWLRMQPEVDPVRVGLWGYSNGAWVASLAAAKDPGCSFLVLTGASGVSPAASEVFRRTEDLRAQGISEQRLNDVERLWNILFEHLVVGQWHEAWDGEVASLAARLDEDGRLARLPKPEFVRANPLLSSVPLLGSDPVASAKSFFPNSRPDMGYDPIPVLEQLSCPLLVVLAENDANLPMAASLPRFTQLAARPGAEVTVVVLSGADHNFGREALSERKNPGLLAHARARSDFRPGYLELMAEWMARQTSV